MEPIRVLLGDLPPLWRGVLRQTLVRQDDMIVVGEVDHPFGILLATARTAADVVILALPDSEFPAVCDHLLREYPRIKILAVAADPTRTALYEMRPHRVPIADVSPEELLDTIRRAVRNGEVET